MTLLLALQVVVALGDSVTLGVRRDGSVTAAQAFPALLQTPGRKVLNAGVGGNNTSQMLDRLDRDVIAHKPHAVLVMAGLNDAAYVDSGPVARTWPRISVEAYKRNLREIAACVKLAGARTILLTPNPMTARYPYSNLGFYRDRDINFSLLPYVDSVRVVAREEGLCLVDVFAVWTARPDLERLLPDGVHPDADGHRLIAEQVERTCPIRISSETGSRR